MKETASPSPSGNPSDLSLCNSDFGTLLESWKSLPRPVRLLLTSYESGSGREDDYDDDEKEVKSDEAPNLDETKSSPSVSSSTFSSPSSSPPSPSPSQTQTQTQTPHPSAPNNVYTTLTGWVNTFTLPISYTVTLSPLNPFDPENPLLLASSPMPKTSGANRRFLAVDTAFYELHSSSITNYFTSHGITPTIHLLPGLESNKTQSALLGLLDALTSYRPLRRECVYAVGGGCVLDVAGLAASLYRRGVNFVRVPTTLLGLVDASVGVKNGVDYCCGGERHKNRVGTFHAPKAVIVHAGFVTTQDARNLSNGVGEVIKLALVRSEELF